MFLEFWQPWGAGKRGWENGKGSSRLVIFQFRFSVVAYGGWIVYLSFCYDPGCVERATSSCRCRDNQESRFYSRSFCRPSDVRSWSRLWMLWTSQVSEKLGMQSMRLYASKLVHPLFQVYFVTTDRLGGICKRLSCVRPSPHWWRTRQPEARLSRDRLCPSKLA